jgi:hypothetical protein
MGTDTIHLGRLLIETAPKIGDLELPARGTDRLSLFDDDPWVCGVRPRDEERNPKKKICYRTERRDE